MEHRDSSPTPEKQLLKLIEQPGAADHQKETLKRRGIQFFSLSAIRGRLSFFRERARGYLTVKKKVPMGVKGTSRVLALCSLALVVYLATDVINSIRELSQAPVLEAAPWKIALDTSEGVSPNSKLYYVEKVRFRNVFDFETGEKIEDKMVKSLPVKKTPEQIMLELMKGLKFEGMIVWPGQDPEVYIRDKEGELHTLKAKDKINGLVVEEIFEKKAILSHGEVRLPLIQSVGR